MKRRRTDGYVVVNTQDGGAWHLDRSQYAAVRHAWLHGVKFFDAVGFHGDTMTIRLDHVDSVIDIPAECLMAERDEQLANEADDSLAGGSV